MAERKQSGGGGRRRKGGDEGPDLFSQGLAEVVKRAFESTVPSGTDALPQEGLSGVGEADASPINPPSSEGVSLKAGHSPEAVEVAAFAEREQAAEAQDPEAFRVAPAEPLPARMLNEFVYCPRLFYYEYVDGVFVENADTARGSALHKRVDKGSSALPKAKKTKDGDADSVLNGTKAAVGENGTEAAPAESADEIHSHSVMLGSERLGVTAKMDLVDATLDGTGQVTAVCPVDYKAGSPRDGVAGLELWDTDRMQLGLQCLLLRDNGYTCDEGIIYYRGTKQRVPLKMTPELETWLVEQIAAARVVAKGPIPPPLIDSPKCARCSLAPVCLPDETRMLSIPTVEKFAIGGEPATDDAPPRLMAMRDQRRALYLNTQGYRVGCNDAVLKVKERTAWWRRSG